MADPIPRIPCEHCAGTGSAPLPPYLYVIYEALSEKGQIGAELCRRLKLSKATINYRLNLLVGYGLARIAGRRPSEERRRKPTAEWVRCAPTKID